MIKTKDKFTKTSLESFKRLRSLAVDDPEWVRLRNEICEENRGLAYDAVNRAGRRLLNSFTGGMREVVLHDLQQAAVTELLRVIMVYDPARPHPLDPDKHIEFATFAYKNLLFKVTDKCKEIEEHTNRYVLLSDTEDEQGASILDRRPAPLSFEEEAQLGKEKRIDLFRRISDSSLKTRLESILNKLRNGDNVTLFERQFLFKLIADPNTVLTARERAGEDFMVSKTHEPAPLRRYRSWRQILN